MAHFNLTIIGSILIALSSIACAGNTASEATDGNESPAPDMTSDTITVDNNGMGCVEVEDNLTQGVSHSVCCHSTTETPDPAASTMCHGTPLLGCSTGNVCIVYTSDKTRKGVECPAGMSCEECFAGGLNAPAAAACG
jgi:hypothetical protein